MRWARETTRKDSERPMSLRWDAGDPSEPEPGDLSVLQLLLRDRQTDRGSIPRRDPRNGRGGRAGGLT